MKSGARLWVVAGLLAVLLVALESTEVRAHKGKLPEDALTLVRQAVALLSQDPTMRGEVLERLRAALKSKEPQGVHLDHVEEAVRALESRDTAAARRLLTAAIMPAGMPMPPQGPSRSAPSMTLAPAPAGQVPAAQSPAAPPLPPASTQAVPPPTVDEAMRMAEPQRSSFSGSTAEILLLAAAAGLIGRGVLWPGRNRDVSP